MQPLRFKKSIDFLFICILILAAFSLFPLLQIKPAQHDEGVNGWFLEDMMSRGYYAYESGKYHGPLHFYILLLFKFLLGKNLWALRLPATLFAFGGIYLITQLKKWVGTKPAYGAALLTAVSPGIIFYSRYAIHESALFFFSLLALTGFLNFRSSRSRVAFWQLTFGFTGMIVTKETYVLSVGCFIAAWFGVKFFDRFSPASDSFPPRMRSSAMTAREAAGILGWNLLIIVLLYSGFLLNWEGLWKFFVSYLDWIKIGASSHSEQKGHWKPFIYWFQLMVHYEWAAVAGLFSFFPLLAPAPKSLRLFSFYGFFIFLAYSLIPYKTPWCIMQILWPFFIVCAGMLDLLFMQRARQWKIVAIALLFIFSLSAAYQTVRVNFFRYADDKEPYVHVQTFKEIKGIHAMIRDLARQDPTKFHMPINIMMKSYWPLSWLLSDFTQVGYYPENFPIKADAGVIFCNIERSKSIELKLHHSYFTKTFRLNSAQAETVVYFDADIFKNDFAPDAPRFVPVPAVPPEKGQGLRAYFYANKESKGPVAKIWEISGLNYSWDETDRPLPAPFSLLAEGEIYIPERGEVNFYLASDDSGKLEIDGQVVAEDPGDHPERIKEGRVSLEKGWHDLKVTYADVGGGAVIRLWWKLPGGQEENIQSRFLRLKAERRAAR